MKVFKYRRSNNEYWNRPKLLITKAFPIAKALYYSYSLLFLFNNKTDHSIFAQNAFHIINIDKQIERKQNNIYYKIGDMRKMVYR